MYEEMSSARPLCFFVGGSLALLPPVVPLLQLALLSLALLLLAALLLLMLLAEGAASNVFGSATTRISSLQYPSSDHIARGSTSFQHAHLALFPLPGRRLRSFLMYLKMRSTIFLATSAT